MTHAQVFQRGFDHGYDAAIHCECDWAPPDGDRTDSLISEAFAAEENARQFSPFEFLAKELNDRDDSADAWDTFEQGVSSGIAAGAKDRLKEKTDE